MRKKFRCPKLFLNLSVQLLCIFAAVLFIGPYLTPFVKSLAYSFSVSMKEVLLFVLPFIIFSCLLHSLVSNQNQAIRFVVILLVTVCFSNFLSVISAYFFGVAGLAHVSLATEGLNVMGPVLEPLWSLKLPTLMSNELSLLLGFGFGLFFSLFPNRKVSHWAKNANHFVTVFLQKIFVPLLPLFALGFIIKMEHEGILNLVLGTYAPIIALLLVANCVYLMLMFGFAAKFKPTLWFNYIKNVLPAGILGFSTMSSMATMPVTLKAAEKNTGEPEMARAIIPATVNIHMIGDSISIPILAMAVLLTFGHSLPSFMQYLLFTQFFMLAKFAMPGIPCGTIFVMLPIFEKYLGFTPEMSAFIAAIYILFDSIITSTNVLGNSAFVILLTRLMRWFSYKFSSLQKPVIKAEESSELR